MLNKGEDVHGSPTEVIHKRIAQALKKLQGEGNVGLPDSTSDSVAHCDSMRKSRYLSSPSVLHNLGIESEDVLPLAYIHRGQDWR